MVHEFTTTRENKSSASAMRNISMRQPTKQMCGKADRKLKLSAAAAQSVGRLRCIQLNISSITQTGLGAWTD